MSHAEVARAAEEAVKDAVMHDAERIDALELHDLLRQRPLLSKRG